MDATSTRRILCAEPAHPPLSVIDAAAGLAPVFEVRDGRCLYCTVPEPAPRPTGTADPFRPEPPRCR